jgi:hypothetical protein|tara:strand:- start:1190 stop:2194 length:1005 start_codon:yes stop_codon:yes gene_type:complete
MEVASPLTVSYVFDKKRTLFSIPNAFIWREAAKTLRVQTDSIKSSLLRSFSVDQLGKEIDPEMVVVVNVPNTSKNYWFVRVNAVPGQDIRGFGPEFLFAIPADVQIDLKKRMAKMVATPLIVELASVMAATGHESFDPAVYPECERNPPLLDMYTRTFFLAIRPVASEDCAVLPSPVGRENCARPWPFAKTHGSMPFDLELMVDDAVELIMKNCISSLTSSRDRSSSCRDLLSLRRVNSTLKRTVDHATVKHMKEIFHLIKSALTCSANTEYMGAARDRLLKEHCSLFNLVQHHDVHELTYYLVYSERPPSKPLNTVSDNADDLRLAKHQRIRA